MNVEPMSVDATPRTATDTAYRARLFTDPREETPAPPGVSRLLRRHQISQEIDVEHNHNRLEEYHDDPEDGNAGVSRSVPGGRAQPRAGAGAGAARGPDPTPSWLIASGSCCLMS